MSAATESLPAADRYMAAERNVGTGSFLAKRQQWTPCPDIQPCRWKRIGHHRPNSGAGLVRRFERRNWRYLRLENQETWQVHSAIGIGLTKPISVCKKYLSRSNIQLHNSACAGTGAYRHRPKHPRVSIAHEPSCLIFRLQAT
jgi:hypothetical protein